MSKEYSLLEYTVVMFSRWGMTFVIIAFSGVAMNVAASHVTGSAIGSQNEKPVAIFNNLKRTSWSLLHSSHVPSPSTNKSNQQVIHHQNDNVRNRIRRAFAIGKGYSQIWPSGKSPSSSSVSSTLSSSSAYLPKSSFSKRISTRKRETRATRQYDVPQIECPAAEDGSERLACPSADKLGRYRCIDDHVLCDGFIDCPNAEDEDRMSCMFFKTTKAHLDVLADALIRWARGRY